MPKRGRVYINQSISFPAGLLAKAKERAQRLGLPFSAYVQKCVQLDLKERKALVFSESEEAVPTAAEEAGRVDDSPKGKRARK